MFKSAPHRRYVLRVAIAMFGYLGTLVLADSVIKDHGATGPVAYGAALLPGLCIAAVFWALGRLLVEETDEYQRLLLVRQLIVATGVTMATISIWGFLADYGLVGRGQAFYPVCLFFVGLGIGALVNKITLGDAGC